MIVRLIVIIFIYIFHNVKTFYYIFAALLSWDTSIYFSDIVGSTIDDCLIVTLFKVFNWSLDKLSNWYLLARFQRQIYWKYQTLEDM